MSVDVLNETSFNIDETEFMALGRFVMDQMKVNPTADLVISLVDTDAMTKLHERFLDEPGPTDVMSFPMDELRPGSQEEGVLGDVVICPEVATKQAAEFGHTPVEEMLGLTVHGILHLMGFDHAEADEREHMFTLQRKLLLAFLASH